MILQKVTFHEPNRNVSSVDDFYYKGYEEKLQGKKGTGVRRVAADMIRTGRILERFLILKNNGCTLEIYTIFKDQDSYDFFTNHKIILAAREFWKDRNWEKSIETINIDNFLSVKPLISDLKPLDEE
jgi:hypothetical protein